MGAGKGGGGEEEWALKMEEVRDMVVPVVVVWATRDAAVGGTRRSSSR